MPRRWYMPLENFITSVSPASSRPVRASNSSIRSLLCRRGTSFSAAKKSRFSRADSRGKNELSVATERSFFPRLSARENLDFFAALNDVPRRQRSERIDELLARTGLLEAGDTLVMKFSSGMYQRLGIARALIHRPSVVLLDEPTRSLDPGSAAQFWNMVRELPSRGATVVLATHNFN